jgi:hypothetical protein
MIPFHELRQGDIVLAEYGGQRQEGEVTEKNPGDMEVCVETEVQSFWYLPKDLYPITLDEAQLFKFGFTRQEMPDGDIKYLKGPFRILISGNGNFSNFEMWYREDRRHITQPLFVHELQNAYHEMTKIDLARDVHAH